MAPPARRRFDSDEELRRKIEALAIMGVPPRLDEPRLDARTALMALADERDAEAEGFSKDPEMPRPSSHLAKEVEPTVEQLYARQKELQLPDVPVQKPMPPKPDLGKPQPAYVEYQRDDNPPPAPAPADQNAGVRRAAANYAAASEPAPVPAAQTPVGPPAPEDVIASARDPFDPRDPAPPVYTPPPEEDRSAAQETGPIPEEVAALPRPPGASSAEAEHARAAMRALQPPATPGQGQAPPPPGAVAADPTLAPGKAPPPSGGPDYSSVAGRVASTPQRGPNPDPFGHDDDGGFTRAEAIRQARAAYDRQSTQGGRHWEDEFLASNPRMGNQEFRRRSIALGLFGGYDRMREAQQDRDKQQQQYAAGLERARLRDQGEQRISRAQAEAFAATGQISPEAAAQMRNNDRLIGQFGQFASQGGRAEHLDYQRDKMMNELHTKIALQEELLKSLKERQGMKDETQKAVADKYASRRKAEKNEERLSPERKRDVIGGLLHEGYRAEGLTGEVAREAAIGVYSNVPQAIRDRVQSESRRLNAFEKVSDFRTTAMAPTVASAKGTINAENSLEAYALKRKNDPQFALEYQTSWGDKSAAVSNAWNAWSQMSDKGKAAFTQWAGDGFAGQVSDALIGTKDGQLIGPIQTLVNELVKERSGATVTDQEWGRLGREVGLANGSYSPFKGTGALEGFIKRAGQRLTRHRQTYERVMGGWK